MWSKPNLPSFDYVKPGSRAEVVDLLQRHGYSARLMMGGTDLFMRMRQGAVHPAVVVDLKGLPRICDIQCDQATGCTIGAAATMNQVAAHPGVSQHYAILSQAARSVASYPIRNRATLGGNACNGSPCADTSPALLALEAKMVIHGPQGQRTIAAKEFFSGPGQTALVPGEFLVAIRLPKPLSGSVGTYRKLGRSKAGDLALVGVAVLGFPAEQQASGYGFRIALGSVAPVAVRATEAERLLASNSPGEEAFAAAAEKAMQLATPISDVRASAAYQKAMVQTLTLRGLTDVWAQVRGRQT